MSDHRPPPGAADSVEPLGSSVAPSGSPSEAPRQRKPSQKKAESLNSASSAASAEKRKVGAVGPGVSSKNATPTKIPKHKAVGPKLDFL